MNGNFLFEQLLDFALPRFEDDFSRLDRTVDPHAKRESMLVLTGEGDEILIAEHTGIIVGRGDGWLVGP